MLAFHLSFEALLQQLFRGTLLLRKIPSSALALCLVTSAPHRLPLPCPQLMSPFLLVEIFPYRSSPVAKLLPTLLSLVAKLHLQPHPPVVPCFPIGELIAIAPRFAGERLVVVLILSARQEAQMHLPASRCKTVTVVSVVNMEDGLDRERGVSSLLSEGYLRQWMGALLGVLSNPYQ